MAEKLSDTPVQPGDIVRDRKTKTDYVVETVAAMAIIGGIMVTGVALWENSVRDFTAASQSEFREQFLTRRRNILNQSPRQVAEIQRRVIHQATGGQETFLQFLKTPRGQPFSDLLLLTNEASEEGVHNAINRLARAVFDLTGSAPTEDQIFRIMRENISNSAQIPDEFLLEFSKDLAEAAKRRATLAHAQEIVPTLTERQLDEFQKVFFNREHRKRNPRMSGSLVHQRMDAGTKAPSKAMSNLFEDLVVDGVAPGDAASLKRVASRGTPRTRYAELLRKSLRAQGSRPGTVEDELVSRWTTEGLDAMFSGKGHESIGVIEEANLGNFKRAYNQGAADTTGWTRAKNEKGFNTVYGNKNVAAPRDYTFSRASSDMKKWAGMAETAEGVLPDTVEGNTRLISMDRATFGEEFLKGSPVVVDGRTVSQSETGVRELMASKLPEGDSILMLPKTMREVIKAKEAGGAIDIDAIASESGRHRTDLFTAGLDDGSTASSFHKGLGADAPRIQHRVVETNVLTGAGGAGQESEGVLASPWHKTLPGDTPKVPQSIAPGTGRFSAVQSGAGPVRFVGSEVPVALEEQFRRADRMFEGQGHFLDVETIDVGGKKVPWNVTLTKYRPGEGAAEHMADPLFTWTAGGFDPMSSEGRAAAKSAVIADRSVAAQGVEGIADAVGSLDTGNVIATHTDFDIRNLSKFARDQGMDDAARLLEQSSSEMLVDASTMYRAAGLEGPVNQQELMHLANREARQAGQTVEWAGGNGLELHISQADNADQAVLWNRWFDRYASGRENLRVLDNAELAKRGETLFFSDARAGASTHGTFKRIHSVGENALGGVEVLAQDVVPTGSKQVLGQMHSMHFDNANIATAALENAQRLTPENADELIQQANAIMEDKMGRWRRGLNPFMQSLSDPNAGTPLAWNAHTERGYFGAESMRVEVAARTEMERTLKRMRTVNFEGDPGIRSDWLQQRVRTIGEDTKTGARIRQRFMELMDSRLEQGAYAARNAAERAYMATPGMELLGKLATKGQGAFGNDTLWMMASSHINAQAWEGPTIKEIRPPRLSIGASWGLETSAALGNAPGTAVEQAVNDLAGKMILTLGGGGEAGPNGPQKMWETIQQITGADASQMTAWSTEAERYRVKTGAVHTSYQSYTQAVRGIGYDAETRGLSTLHQRLASSEAMLREITTAVDAPLLDSTAQHTEEALAAGRRLSERVRAMQVDGDATLSTQLREIMFNESADNADLVNLYRAEQEVPDMMAAMSRVNAEALEEKVAQQASDIYAHGGSEAFEELGADIFAERQKLYAAARQEGTRPPPRESDTIASRLINERWERAQTARQATADTSFAGGKATNVTRLAVMARESATGAGTSSRVIRQTLEAAEDISSAAGRQAFSKYMTPLMVVGGALALMAAREPKIGEETQPGHTPGKSLIPKIMSMSEIPIPSDGLRVWHGEEEPFRLDMNMRGFVANRRQRESLMRSVYDTVSGHSEVRSTTTDVSDRRNRSHRLAAQDVLRRALG